MKNLTKELLDSLSREYGDSYYILDSDVFKDNSERLISSFKKYYDNFNIAYSYKTNYIPKLVKAVDRLGGFAEVVSDMEVNMALKSGVRYDRIIWNGPVKNKAMVKDVLLNGGTVNIDSYTEFEHIKRLASDYPKTVFNIGVRCNYDVGDGVLSRFGVDVSSDEFDSILKEISAIENLRLVSFQAHFAKRSPEYWTKRTEGMLKVHSYAKDKYGICPERLDLGGGIYGEMPESLRIQLGVAPVDFEDYASRSAKLFAEFFANESERPMLIVEPGTAVAANCMQYVCRVETIKNIRGKAIASVNGSQKNISISGINPPMDVISAGESRQHYADLDIAGYTCIESDYLYKGYNGDLGVGDYIVFGNCGSYSIVMKPPFIFTNVPVVDISGDGTEVIKRAETFDDLFSTYNF